MAEPQVATVDAAVALQFDKDVAAALRELGFKSEEARRAVAATAHLPANTLEERLRTALAQLMRRKDSRCREQLRWNGRVVEEGVANLCCG